jgi:hypothetical protein
MTLDEKIALAKQWLGARYLLAKPINHKRSSTNGKISHQ